MKPDNLVIVLIGQVILNTGIVPAAYVFPTLMASVFDEIEYKNGFRCDGVATGVINSMNTIAVGLSIGIFNLLIRGYIQPEFDSFGNCHTVQPDSVLKAIVWAFVGINVFIHGGLAVLLRFLDVEIKMPHIQRIIKERQIAECEAKGEKWISPEERAKQLQEELDKKALEDFKAELKAKPDKDYEAELQKYIQKTNIQKEKAKIKEEKRIKDEEVFMERMKKYAIKKGMEI